MNSIFFPSFQSKLFNCFIFLYVANSSLFSIIAVVAAASKKKAEGKHTQKEEAKNEKCKEKKGVAKKRKLIQKQET